MSTAWAGISSREARTRWEDARARTWVRGDDHRSLWTASDHTAEAEARAILARTEPQRLDAAGCRQARHFRIAERCRKGSLVSNGFVSLTEALSAAIPALDTMEQEAQS